MTRPIFPNVLSADMSENTVMLSLEMREDLLYFDGHFESVAILPGVVQVHWAEHYGREYFSSTNNKDCNSGFDGEFSHLEAIKFQHVIRANAVVTLSLRYDDKKGKLHFSYVSDGGSHSSGRLATKTLTANDNNQA